jgi:uncharacterized membrane protein required for colicin V production
MTLLDLLVIVLIGGLVAYYYYRGFAVAVLSFAAFILSFVLARLLYPVIASFMRNTGSLFDNLKGWVSDTLNLGEIANRAGAALTLDRFLENLTLPQFVKNQLLSGNDESTRSLLNVSNVAPVDEFVSAFIAGAIINIIAMIIAFVASYVLIKVGVSMVDVATKLPVIKQINKFFGAGLGAVLGLFLSWAVLTVLVWIFGNNPSFHVNDMLERSLIAGILQDLNIISRIISF